MIDISTIYKITENMRATEFDADRSSYLCDIFELNKKMLFLFHSYRPTEYYQTFFCLNNGKYFRIGKEYIRKVFYYE